MALDTDISLPVTEPNDSAEATGAGPEPRRTVREVWQRGRVAIVVGAVLLLLAGVVALTNGRVRGGYLTMDGTRPAGGRALAQLLTDRGVDVRPAVTAEPADDTTTFVPVPELVEPAALAALLRGTGHDLVLAGPSPQYLDALADAGAPRIGLRDEVGTDTLAPDCDEPAAVAAGPVELGGYAYQLTAGDHACYPTGGGAALIVAGEGSSRLVVLGSGHFLANDNLADEGNAALGLGLLSRHDTVRWLLPPPPSGSGTVSLRSLLPTRLKVALWQLAVAVLLLGIARAIRLGRLVVEPLPVVVRAAESVEGRARLYRSGHARGRAGDALRRGARDRLVRALGLRTESAPDAVAGAVAAHSRRPASAVAGLLYGPPPGTDAELVRLAADLDDLEREVRTQ